MRTTTAALGGADRSIALVRGEALNPFEMQAYGPLTQRFQLSAVGRTHPNYEVDALPMPVTLLHSISAHRVLRGVHRRSPFAGRVDPNLLAGLERAVRGVEVLHAAETFLPVSEQCARVAGKTRAKLVLTCWETIPFRYDDDPRLAHRKAMVKAQADRFIAVTDRAKAALVAEGVNADRITVVPAAVDCARFAPQEPSADLRRSWQVPADALVVLYIGRMIQEKGVTELVRAFAASDRPDHAYLVLVGNGDQASRAALAAEALGIGDRVRTHSGVSYQQLPQHHASADVVAVPSLTTPYWEEQFGMVLAEAMACCRPILTTRSGAIPEVVGDAAHVVEPYEVDQLADGLSALLNDADHRRLLGAAGRQRAFDRYDLPVVSEQLAAVYDGL